MPTTDEMTKRERVEATLQRLPTDRVPVYDILLNDAVMEYFTGRFPPVGEEGLKLRLQATAQTLDMTRMAGVGPTEPGERTDEDGFVHFQEDRWMYGGLRGAFHDEAGAKAWLAMASARLREPQDLRRYAEDFRAGWQRIAGYLGDDTVVLHGETGTGLDELRMALGLELFSYLWADAPEMIREFLELSTQAAVERIHAVADRALSPCALTYGDIAYKGRLMHSPDWLRREFCPLLARLNEAWHAHGVLCLFHSDGYLMEILPNLLATGIDGLNPIEIVAGMDLAEVKRLYGDRLFFAGGIDVSQLMARENPAEVAAVCRAAIAAAAPGYFLGSTTEFDNGAQLSSYLAMLETAWGQRPSP